MAQTIVLQTDTSRTCGSCFLDAAGIEDYIRKPEMETDTSPTADDLTSLEKRIDSLDLECIKVKLMDHKEGKGWTLEHADEAEKWYKRFLFFCAKDNDNPLVPVGDIDHFWHQHILDTRKYAADCDFVFGYFMHHFPYFGMRGDDDAAALQTAGEDTLQLFRAAYGETPFDAVSQCHDCKKCTSCFVGDPACKKGCQEQCKKYSGVASEIRPTTVR